MALTARQESILKAIVDHYIAGAHPVGSAVLAGTAGLGVSPATIRNEMAVLEDLGYVRHLHTSGGRVPTSAGYRYYVEHLMAPARLPGSEERTIRHQFHQAPTEVQEWLRLAANIMAHRMRNVGLVTAPKAADVRLRHCEVISIQDTVALLIVVLQDGTVLQEMMALPEPRSQEDLSGIAVRLNQRFHGQTAAGIDTGTWGLEGEDAVVAAAVAHLLRRGESGQAQVYHAGLPDLIQQPEFIGPRPGESPSALNERLRHMVEFLHQGSGMQHIVANLSPDATVHIVIGGETPAPGLEDYSFVLGRYGDEEESSGFLGVVGPMRMQYPRAVALVQYMSDLMTDLMQAY